MKKILDANRIFELIKSERFDVVMENMPIGSIISTPINDGLNVPYDFVILIRDVCHQCVWVPGKIQGDALIVYKDDAAILDPVASLLTNEFFIEAEKNERRPKRKRRRKNHGF